MEPLGVVGLSVPLMFELLRVAVRVPMHPLPSSKSAASPPTIAGYPNETSAAAEAVDRQAFLGGAGKVADEVDEISFCGWAPTLGEGFYAIAIEWL